MQLFKAHRGQQDYHLWLGRFGVMVKRLQDSWVDCLADMTDDQVDQIPEVVQAVANARAAAIANEHDFDAALIPRARQEHREARRLRHRNAFPLSDNLLALVTLVLADLSENQRERLTSTLNLRSRNVENYTYEEIRSLFMDLFCVPRNSWENPTLVHRTTSRSFCILEEGYLDNQYGYWAEDDDTGESGFLHAFDNVFWTYEDEAEAWAVRRFQARKVRKGPPKGKGKRKGKGRGGYRFSGRKDLPKERPPTGRLYPKYCCQVSSTRGTLPGPKEKARARKAKKERKERKERRTTVQERDMDIGHRTAPEHRRRTPRQFQLQNSPEVVMNNRFTMGPEHRTHTKRAGQKVTGTVRMRTRAPGTQVPSGIKSTLGMSTQARLGAGVSLFRHQRSVSPTGELSKEKIKERGP